MATPIDNAVPLTGNPKIDGLTQGSAWQLSAQNRVITYSFSVRNDPSYGTWNQALMNGVKGALAAWSNVANISFIEADSGSLQYQSTADIAFFLTGNNVSSNSNDPILGLGIFPSPSFADQFIATAHRTRNDYPRLEGDIAIANNNYYLSSTDVGSYGFMVLLHEIGHALGLKHPFDSTNNRPTFSQLGIAGLEHIIYSVMNYADNIHQYSTLDLFDSNPATPMMLDILAIQNIYGANTTYHSGNDNYQLGGLRDYMETIWDPNGNDTISMNIPSSNASTFTANGPNVITALGTDHVFVKAVCE